MNILLAAVALAIVVAVIWMLGGGGFGRAQTQAWIDRVRGFPRVFAFLNRHHGKFRAAAHYVEFGGLFFVLYWLQDAALGGGRLAFRWIPAGVIALLSVLAAWLDEMHQLKSGTRQFRREDFLHSCCGICIAMMIVFLLAVARGVE